MRNGRWGIIPNRSRRVALAVVVCLSTISCYREGASELVRFGRIALLFHQPQSGSPIVELTIRNNSQRPILISSERLPWRSTSGFVVRATSCGLREYSLRRIYAIDDPPPGNLTIAPGESVTQRLDLRWYFADITEALRSANVCLFWRYEMRDTAGHEFGTHDGRFVLRAR